MSQTDLKWRWKSLRFESQSAFFTEQDYRTRDNYIKGLTDNYAESDVKEIIEKIRSIDIKDFLEQFLSVDLNSFEWASGPPNQEQYDSYLKKLKGEWLGLTDDELGFSTKSRARYGLVVNGNIIRSSNNPDNLESLVEKGNDSVIMDFENNMIIKSFK